MNQTKIDDINKITIINGVWLSSNTGSEYTDVQCASVCVLYALNIECMIVAAAVP